MTAPALGAQRFLAGCLLGAGLGIWYGFLRPLRPKHVCLSDALFLTAAAWAWLELMFRICRGDLRPGAFFGLILGALVWECTVGKLLRPVFSGFWEAVIGFFVFLTLPCKKILKKMKILFASVEKWVTIR